MKPKQFKSLVASAASQMGMKVIEIRESGITPNFHLAHLKNNDSSFCVVRSEENIWAFCEYVEPMICELVFIENEELTKILDEQFGIKVLTKKELESPFIKEPYMINSDVNYWLPKNKGEGLFNWWD
jgi:hypothetical protein